MTSLLTASNSRLGTELSPTDQAEVLRAFPHRFTAEHFPAWAKAGMPNGKPYPVQFASDADWLAHTRFSVTKAGRLSRAHRYCHSSPTWPYNPELR